MKKEYTLMTKPLSVNECYNGRRSKNSKYKGYEKEIYYQLPNNLHVPEGKLLVYYTFGLSNKNSDWDNHIKCFQDILQKKYEFNDNRIYKAVVEKVDVKKGSEFIQFSFSKYAQ